MKKFKKYIISAIAAAVLSFIIGKLINPALEIFYSYFLKIGTFFLKSFSDSVYKEISNGFSEQSSLLLLSIVLSMSAGISLGAVIQLEYVKKKTFKRINDLKSEQVLKQQNSSENEVPKEKLEDSLTLNKKTRLNKLETAFQKIAKPSRFSELILIFCICSLFFFYARCLFINNAITKATNNIEIVSPYITDIEYKQLKSDFYSIKNRDDYNALMDTLADIADANSITLKK